MAQKRVSSGQRLGSRLAAGSSDFLTQKEKVGIYAAVTRRTTDDANPDGWLPEQKISVEEALTAYTSANAYAGFEEDKAGTLEQGKRADLVILSADPRKVAPEEIRKIKVLTTIIDGEVVYQSTLK